MTDIKENLQKVVGKENLLCDEPMKLHTSFKIGGPADFFVKLKNIEQLKNVKKIAIENSIPFVIVGNGTNLLVKDKGIRGIVAKLDFNKIEIDSNSGIIKVSGDYSVSKLSRRCAENSLAGAEFLSGIPGTVGGAVRMNAGAFGGEIKDILVKTTYLDENFEIKEFSNEEQDLSYRHSIFCDNQKWIVLEAELKLEKDDKDTINYRIEELIKTRVEKQPMEYPSAGSTFKRLPGKATAALIDECGLKGYRVGGAEVSTKHAGFIINRGNATAEDVLNLVEIVKTKVYERFNENIELEVVIMGE